MTLPKVSVIIPALNEEADLGDCLDHLLAQTYPLDALEVIVVVDVRSTDRTLAIAEERLAAFPGAHVVQNRRAGGTPSNLNTGLAAAVGELICRVDARSRVQPDHVAICAEVLGARREVSVVGGAQVAIARSDNARDIGIARALNNRYAMGLARYRRRGESGASDTVYLGAFRRAELLGVGGWDERLATNQDFELNRRMGRIGLVWFDARLCTKYVPRPTLRELFGQYRRFGSWKVAYWRLTGDPPRPRQLVLLLGALAAAICLTTPRTRRPALTLAAVGSVVVDASGSAEPAHASARAHAIAAMFCTSAGWVSGVAAGFLRRAV